MKIDKAIVSSDDNPFYLDFWPLVSRVWKEKFGITPVLLYVSDSEYEPTTEYGEVYKYKPVEGVPVYLQTLWVRYFHPSTEPETTWAISDIDMFPVSREYFLDRVSSIEDNSYVHLDPSIGEYKKFPSCYHIAKGSVFTDVLDLPLDWEMSAWQVHSSNLGSDPGGHLTGKTSWFADEQYATNKILQKINIGYNNIKFIERDGGRYGHRLDRSNFVYDTSMLDRNEFYDCHSIRPYSQYKNQIDKLVEDILASKC